MKRRKTKKLWLILLLVILCGWVLLYFTKGMLLDIAIKKVQNKLKTQYHINLTLKSYELKGWTHVNLAGVDCRTFSKDSLAFFKDIHADIRLWPLLKGKVRLQKVELNDGIIDLSALRKVKSSKNEKSEGDTGNFARVKKYLGYLKNMADIMPDNFLIRHVNMRYADSSGPVSGFIDSTSYFDNHLSTKVIINDHGQNQTWLATGSFDKNSLETHLNVKSDVTGFYEFALVKKIARAEFGFRSYTLDIDKLDDNSNEIYLKGAFSAEKVLIYNPKLSTDTISIDNGGLDFSMKLTPDHLVLDSASRLHLNDLTASLSTEYKYSYPADIHARLELAPVPAQNIINAMPGGAFDIARTMKLEGNMGYNLDFYLNIDTKDSIHIDANVINNGVHVTDYGKAQLRKISGPFTYYPYNSRRPILVDSANPEYTPLRLIPKILTDAVVSSEDPNFYGHHGIEEDAIEAAFLKDLQKGSFGQGGSTITMQLVKNVFLTHKKSIDRKLEEFFLVWLLENTHITSKNRILEVYLNIIEWGPDVYGIGEASRFYFNKTPAQLNLNECIFLAKIIPQPLGFMNRFDAQGNLKENFQHKVLSTVDRMAKRGKLDEEEQGSYWPEVKITGPAKNLIKIVPELDSMRIKDSIQRANDW